MFDENTSLMLKGASINEITVEKVEPENALYPILVTELGMVIEDRPMQKSKTECPILVTELPMVTEVRLVLKEYLQVVFYQ